MRRTLLTLIAVCILSLIAPGTVFAAGDKNLGTWLDSGKLEQGLVGIRYHAPKGAVSKLIVQKHSESTYTYDLISSGELEYFPLQSGNGAYVVTIAQHVSGNKYKAVHSNTVQLDLKDAHSVYLGSIQNVNWSESTYIPDAAAELTKGAATVEDKVKAIYAFVIKEIEYDTKLAAEVVAGYIPDVDKTYTSGKGICYDYAALFAAMLRSLDIPTKLVMGTSDHVEGYHAWNEVYMNDQWVLIDTTIDASISKKDSPDMIKDTGKYTVAKVY